MKKMLFSAIAMVAFAGSAFASNEIIVEALKADNDKTEQATVPCRWRTVYHYSNGTVQYGPWQSGDCYDTINGKGERLLVPIRYPHLSPNP